MRTLLNRERDTMISACYVGRRRKTQTVACRRRRRRRWRRHSSKISIASAITIQKRIYLNFIIFIFTIECLYKNIKSNNFSSSKDLHCFCNHNSETHLSQFIIFIFTIEFPYENIKSNNFYSSKINAFELN